MQKSQALHSADIPWRCTAWQLRTRSLEFGDLPALMGIVNVTPDSFSDGGKYFTPSQAVDHALRLEDAGASILDVGGESTRPYSDPVAAEEEWRRIEPVLGSLVGRVSIPISIDTSKSSIARRATEMGVEIINDVTGLEGDPEMLAVAAQSAAGVCAMHMQGTPQSMQDDPHYENVVHEIYDYLQQRDHALQAAGIDANRICLDPGIGFGKSHAHNLELLRGCQKFLELRRPILIGHSRKGFISKILGAPSTDRTLGSLGVSLALAAKQIPLLRVHDVAGTQQALACFAACGL
ncbi:dihydropteroate synthase [Aureliella helgolandensis]|uniref:Dihydropteroate synthase n=1 Tax=Aureliella helgolandensis TaxID=2527968 RepID=A0A518G5D1_9BACT|nr:dihydropteroate synthase [Aureliella helgolandensis]QDV23798.1 Dihydropteroate synthase [Aureliella helgolandensis]